jgi:glyoxylase-like metal-dependent hydrolase (beta-lactamase superfamily II)
VIRTLDLLPADGGPGMIAAYLLPDAGPALVDCGAATHLPALERALEREGAAVEDLRHLLLTHIHLDHAGAAGALAARVPGLTVWVHVAGARHLVDPTRLVASARRVFGERMDELWGPVTPVPAARIAAVEEASTLPVPGGVEALPTPGHARHHLAYLLPDGTCCTGDVAGVAYAGSGYLEPDGPPPDIDVPLWQSSVAAIAARRPERLALAHFDLRDEPLDALGELRDRLGRWGGWVGDGREAFARRADTELHAAVGGEVAAVYRHGSPLDHSFDGFARWREQALDAGPAT